MTRLVGHIIQDWVQGERYRIEYNDEAETDLESELSGEMMLWLEGEEDGYEESAPLTHPSADYIRTSVWISMQEFLFPPKVLSGYKK